VAGHLRGEVAQDPLGPRLHLRGVVELRRQEPPHETRPFPRVLGEHLPGTLTELITVGQIGNGSEGMFAYGKRVVKSRFGEASVLFVVDRLVSGVVRAFNRTLDFVAGLLPIPGLSSVVSFANSVIYAATTYIDETIFSYGLARQETNPWASAKDGLIYYAQNSREILKTGIYAVMPADAS